MCEAEGWRREGEVVVEGGAEVDVSKVSCGECEGGRRREREEEDGERRRVVVDEEEVAAGLERKKKFRMVHVRVHVRVWKGGREGGRAQNSAPL